MSSLRVTALRGGAWTVGAQGGHFVIQIASISVLARLLAPEDFGLIGMLAAVISLLGLFREMGLSTAIVQRSSIASGELTRIFWLSVYLGIVLFILTAASGFGAAWLMEEPRLIAIAPWFGACFLLGSLETVPAGILRRNLRFRSIAVRDVTVRLIGLFAAVTAALAGFGYWSLVVQAVASALLQLVFTWTAAAWWPREPGSPWKTMRPYAGFGAAFTGSNLASYLTQNLDSLLIGKIWGAVPLGYYSRARMLMIQPVNQFVGPVATVLLPVFCRIKDDSTKMRKTIAALSIPFLVLPCLLTPWLIVGAPEVVRILLGLEWEGTTNILRWLAGSIIYLPIGTLLYLVLVSSGRTTLLMHWTWTGALAVTVGYIIGVRFGVVWVAAAFTLTGILVRVPIAVFVCNKTGLIDAKRLMASYGCVLVSGIGLCVLLNFCRNMLKSADCGDLTTLAVLSLPAAIILLLAIGTHPLRRMRGILRALD